MELAIPGYIEGSDYVETPDSPTITREKTTRKIMCKHSIGEQLFDTLLTMHGQSGLDAAQCSLQAGIYDTITIVFVRDSSTVISFTTGNVSAKSFTADANGAEHALEELSNYKFCWNHNLYQCLKPENSPVIPAWAESATSGVNADGKTYLWADQQPSAAPEGYGWREILHRKKKADSFLYPELTVHEYRTFRNREAAIDAIDSVGTRRAPNKTFGKTSDAKYWLIMRSSVSDDNGVFTLQTDYQYSPTGWDTDIYS